MKDLQDQQILQNEFVNMIPTANLENQEDVGEGDLKSSGDRPRSVGERGEK